MAADDNTVVPVEQMPMKSKVGQRKLRAAAKEDGNDKQNFTMPKDAPSLQMAEPEPAAKKSQAEAPAAEGMMRQEQQPIASAETQSNVHTRRFAERFYVPNLLGDGTTDQQSSTIFWLPKFTADENGKASIYFNLPERAGSFRVVVEAHGDGRLGSGELLIDSREPVIK